MVREQSLRPRITPSSDAKVGGRLLKFAWAWQPAQRWQRSIAIRGVTWTWTSDPPLKLPHLIRGHPDLDPLVADFVEKGVIREVVRKASFVSRIFTVPKSDGSRRLILDLKNLNSFLTTPKFKMSNHNVLRKVLPHGSYMAKIDIKDAYLHLPIAYRLQKFLSFVHNHKVYAFQALPFGLAIAPYIFTRILKFPLKRLRASGVQVLAYLDDLILWHQDKVTCQKHAKLTVETLQELGFLINFEKSILSPSRTITWLGVVWYGTLPSVGLTQEFIMGISSMASELSKKSRLSRKELEKLLGKAAFAGQIIPQARLESHELTPFLRSQETQSPKVMIAVSEMKETLKFWSVAENLVGSFPCRPPSPTLTVWTDASGRGFGAVTSEDKSIQGLWAHQEQTLHTNVKELMAVTKAVESNMIRNKTSIILATDNTTTMYVVKNLGSNHSPELQKAFRLVEELI